MSETNNEIEREELDFVEQSDKEHEIDHEYMYVVSIDGVPVSCEDNVTKARETMWLYMEDHKIMKYPDWNTYIEERTDDELQLIGGYKFNIISYDQILSEYKVTRVERSPFKEKTKDD